MNISDLVDQEALRHNLSTLSNTATDTEIANKMKEWIEVSVDIDYPSVQEKAENGQYNASILTQSFDAMNEQTHFDIDLSSTTASKRADELAEEQFSSFDYATISPWGNDVYVTSDLLNYDANIATFCNGLYGTSRYSEQNYHNPHDEITDSISYSNTSFSSTDYRIEAYPNPSKKVFNIEYTAKDKGRVQWVLNNVLGEVLLTHNDYVEKKGRRQNGRITIPDHYQNGMYVLNILFENGEAYNIQLIKQND